MAKQMDVYKCSLCGQIVEVLQGGDGELVCCGEPMNKLVVKSAAEEGKEKHVPVIEKADGKVTVKVGSVQHPMEEDHYIQWIQLLADGKAYRQYLKPGDVPQAVFNVDASEVSAREHCNKHGLWEGK